MIFHKIAACFAAVRDRRGTAAVRPPRRRLAARCYVRPSSSRLEESP